MVASLPILRIHVGKNKSASGRPYSRLIHHYGDCSPSEVLKCACDRTTPHRWRSPIISEGLTQCPAQRPVIRFNTKNVDSTLTRRR